MTITINKTSNAKITGAENNSNEITKVKDRQITVQIIRLYTVIMAVDCTVGDNLIGLTFWHYPFLIGSGLRNRSMCGSENTNMHTPFNTSQQC